MVKTIAAEAAWTCSICGDDREDAAYAIPCHHEFCLGCILHWTKQKASCLLCRRLTTTIKFPAWADDGDLEFIVCPPATPVLAYFQVGTTPGPLAGHISHSPEAPHPPAMPVPDEQGAVDTEFSAPLVPALPPEVWVALFQEHQEILDPLLPWLRQELAVIFGTVWWQAMLAENFILAALCLLGLDSKALFLHLQPGLADRTAMLVHGIINTVVQRADLEAAGPPPRLHCQGAGGQTRGHPPHRHLLTGDSQLQPATLLLHYRSQHRGAPQHITSHPLWGHSQPLAAPILGGQEETREEPGQAAAVEAAGPSARTGGGERRCWRRQSRQWQQDPHWGRDHSHSRPRPKSLQPPTHPARGHHLGRTSRAYISL